MPVGLGSERLLASGELRGARVGVVCNPASVDAAFRHVVHRIAAAEDVTLAAVFGPQHGFRADVQDNMIETPHARDPRRGVPVYSLYSETREPAAAMLEGLDALVIDLQDVGTRVYTFVYTMANCLRAAARHGLKVFVCDRPNPIGGEAVEGPVLDEAYRSFVGQFAIPLRHGLTIGELARLFNDRFGIGARLEVVAMEGWRRPMYHDATGLPWVLPSPNLPTLDSAVVYPGMVLLEGTNLSEGRGTTRPFEIAGAPWIDADLLAGELNDAGLAGVHFRPAVFEPTFQKHTGQTCGGCQLHVTDRAAFRPVEAAVAFIAAARRADRRRERELRPLATLGKSSRPPFFAWRDPPYEYETEKMPIDILSGSDQLRRQIEAGMPAADIAAGWTEGAEEFRKTRERFLLY